MKISLCTIAFSELPLAKVLDISAECGFDGVEIWGKDPHIPDEYDAGYVKAIPIMARERGLKITSFGSYVNPLMENYEKCWDTAFKITQNLGTRMMRVWSGGGASKNITAENKSLIISRFKEMSRKAEKLGIILAVEMHGGNFTDTARAILELMRVVDHPNLRTYYQPVFDSDSDDPYEAARMIGEYVVNVHAQNAKIAPDSKVSYCEIAEGVVDYKKVVEILKSRGFDGDLEVEFVRGKQDSPELEEKIAYLKRDYDFLAKITAFYS